MKKVYFITHPDVVVDPAVPVPQWPLSARGKDCMRQMLAHPWVNAVESVYCSTEQKAIDGAAILAAHLSLDYVMVEALGENDRSSTGYLPGDEFWATAALFFARPDESVRGWEIARDAQRRIVDAVDAIVENDDSAGDIAIVSHGGVGTLYLCHLKGCPISQDEGQPGTSGGCYYCFEARSKALLYDWRTIDSP
jgi:broad specificity phosphatase PhoE